MRANTLDAKLLEIDGQGASGGSNPNLLINGNMKIWQRGTGTFSTSNGYSADRWRFTESSAAALNIDQSTTVPNSQSQYSALATVATADTSVDSGDWVVPFHYTVEGYDYAKLINQYGTLSFWIRSNLTGTYSVSFRNADADRSYVVDYTINQANTWEKKEITVLFDADGNWNTDALLGLSIYWCGMVGSTRQGSPGSWLSQNALGSVNQINWAGTVSNTMYLSQAKLEVGQVATPFIDRPISEELSLCQRYFQKTYNYDVVPGTASLTGSLYCRDNGGAGSAIYGSAFRFSPPMRVNPTVVTYDGAGTAGKISSGGTNGFTSNVSVMWWGFRYWGCGSSTGTYLAMQFTADAELI